MPELPAERLLAALGDVQVPTPAQRLVAAGDRPPSNMTSLERFPYYTAFPFAWYVAAYTDEIAPGELRPLRRLARDLVVWRTEDGVAHVMDAYCPHRGASLAVGGRVDGCALVCPYHLWQWDGAGRNTSIPYRDTPDDRRRVRSYPTVERNGFILFWYHPDPREAPRWEVPETPEVFGPAWTPFLRMSWEHRCPWQEVAENFPDNVHSVTVHGTDPRRLAHVTELRFEGYRHHVRASTLAVGGDPSTVVQIETDAHGPGFSIGRSTGPVELAFFLAITPVDWERTVTTMAYKIRRAGMDAVAVHSLEEAIRDSVDAQWREDFAIFDHKVHVADLGDHDEDSSTARYRAWAGSFMVPGDPIAEERLR